jgi:tetratricopeptide (TPR) repeat protein
MLILDELSEEAIRAKMEARAFAADRLEALRVFEAWKAQIAEEVGAVPSPLIEGMAARLRKRNIEREHETRVAEVSTELWHNRPFVGRADDYERLYQIWEEVRGGRASHAYLIGESGVGKSTLIDRLATAAGLEGAAVSRVQCYELDRSLPFSAVSSLVEGLLGQSGSAATPPDALASIARIVPAVKTHFPSIPESPPTEGEAARLLLAEGIQRLAVAVADEVPVLLVIDDAHHADEASLTTLQLLVRRARDCRLMVILAGRPVEIANSPAAAKIRAQAKQLGFYEREITPLPSEDAATLLDMLLAGSPPPNRSVRLALLQGAAGYPMVLELLVRDWTTHGETSLALAVGAMTGEVAPRAASTAPYAVLLDSVLQSLDSPARAVLNMAALLGRDLNEIALYSIAGVSTGQTMAAMGELVTARILRDSGQRLEFVNELMRAEAYLLIPSPLRRVLHHQVANTLIARHSAGERMNALTIAWHCMRANLISTATEHLLQGARDALGVGALQEAERSLATGIPSLSEPQRTEALFLLVDVLQEQARWSESLSILQTLPANLSDRDRDFQRILTIDCLEHVRATQTFVVHERFQELLLIARRTSDCFIAARAIGVAANLTGWLGDSEAARSGLEVVSLLDISGLLELEHLRFTLAVAQLHYYAGDFESAKAWVVDTMSLARTTTPLSSISARLLIGLGAIAISAGDYSGALEPLNQGHNLAARLANDDLVGQSLGNIALCKLRLGEYACSIELAEQSFRLTAGLEAQPYTSAVISYLLGNALLNREELVLDAVRRDQFSLGRSGQLAIRMRWQLLAADALTVVGKQREAIGVARGATWPSETVVPAGRSPGPFARWAVATAQSSEEQSLARKLIERLLESVNCYDMIDRAEILLAAAALDGMKGHFAAKLATALNALPAPVETQLRRATPRLDG